MPQNTPGNPAGNPNDPKKVSIVGKVPIEYDLVGLKDISNAIHEQTAAQQQAGNDPDSVSERGVKEQKKTNAIAKLAVFVSGAALASTVAVIILNYKAIDAANKSTSVADSSFIESRREFELANRPFIQMSDLHLDSMNAGQKPVIRYSLSNVGHFPASVDEITCGMGTGGGPGTAEDMMKAYERTMVTRYDIGTIPFTPITDVQTMTSQTPYSKGATDSFAKGQMYVGLVLKIKYRDALTQRTFHMTEVLKMGHNQSGLDLSSLKYTDVPDSSK